jgi:hypothetical protein
MEHIEILTVEVNMHRQQKIAIITVYNPPKHANLVGARQLHETLTAVRRNGFENICLMGDFNLPNLDINTGIPTSPTHSCELFYDIFQDFGLVHVLESPTHKLGNRLDLIVTTCPELFSNITIEADSYPSDHFLIKFSLDSVISCKKATRYVFNFKKANWQGVKQYLRSIDFDGIINNMDNLSDACCAWTNRVLESVKLYVPVIKLNINSPPWIDGEVIYLSKKKETARKKAHRTNTQEAWSTYRKHRNNLRTLTNRKYNNYIREISSNLCTNPKRFWGLIRSKRKTRSIPAEVHYANRVESNPTSKATLFN